MRAVALDPRAAPGVDLRLWLVDLDADEGAPDGSPLPDAVLQRAARFARDVDRRRYLASHRALRRLLGTHAFDIAGGHGKPALAHGPHFNLSRRDGWAAVASSRSHEVGVDVETLRRIDDARELAALHFSPREREAVAHDGNKPASRAFLRVWTRKEACMKAVGLGLALPPSSFECGAQADPAVVHLQLPARGACTLTVGTHDEPGAPVVLSWAVVST
jgi:4'-phosphopantetheinyl transferase